MTISVLRVSGVGERPGTRVLLDEVTKHLDRNRFRVVDVPHAVSYGPVGGHLHGHSFDRSLALGVHTVLQAIDDDPHPVVLLGYSGGASVIGHAAAEIGKGLHPHLDVRGVGLVADPHMRRGISPHGHGVAGSRPITGIPVWWAYSNRDPIPVTPELSPLRTVSDQSSAMSLGDPAAWGRDLANRMMRSRWQPSAIDWRDPIASVRRYHDAAGAVIRYALHHTTDYTGEPAEALAQWITETTQ